MPEYFSIARNASDASTAIQQVSNFAFYSIPLQPPAPFLQSLTLSGSTFAFNWNAVTGMVYQVQYSTNLLFTNWLNFQSPLTATNTILGVTDIVAAQPRFYRVITVP